MMKFNTKNGTLVQLSISKAEKHQGGDRKLILLKTNKKELFLLLRSRGE
jgi:hypothetical protein